MARWGFLGRNARYYQVEVSPTTHKAEFRLKGTLDANKIKVVKVLDLVDRNWASKHGVVKWPFGSQGKAWRIRHAASPGKDSFVERWSVVPLDGIGPLRFDEYAYLLETAAKLEKLAGSGEVGGMIDMDQVEKLNTWFNAVKLFHDWGGWVHVGRKLNWSKVKEGLDSFLAPSKYEPGEGGEEAPPEQPPEEKPKFNIAQAGFGALAAVALLLALTGKKKHETRKARSQAKERRA